MPVYRKKPVKVEAVVFEPGMEDGIDSHMEVPNGNHPKGFEMNDPHNTILYPYIKTLEGKHYIDPGDYIITGVNRERYPCKPDIFEKTYEKVDE